MASRPSLPYFAPPDRLSAPLPTMAEILESKDRLSDQWNRPVIRVRDHFAVKYGGPRDVPSGG
jgi:hypothetical protein